MSLVPSAVPSRPLRVFVIAHANRAAGGKSVAINLLEALSRRRHEVQVQPVLSRGCGYEDIVEKTSLDPIWFHSDGNPVARWLFDTFELPRRGLAAAPDAILALGNIGLLRPRVPQAVLVHDAHYVYPRKHYGPMGCPELARYAFQRRQLQACIRKSAQIYCQTKTMRDRLCRVFAGAKNVRLLRNCLPSAVRPSEEVSMPDRLGAVGGRKFRLICLTRYYAHKNLEAIVEAYRIHRSALKDTVVFLTISPEQGRGAARLLNTINRYGLGEQIINLGPISQHDIPAYFQHCHALLLPTKLESFSATYLEAMHCGLPIMTSDLDFAHEICGEAAIYFNPWTAKSIVNAIVQLRTNHGLCHRLISAGYQQLSGMHTHSWDDLAEIVISDLRSCTRTRG